MRRLSVLVCLAVAVILGSAVSAEAGNCNRGVPGVLNLNAGRHGAVAQVRIVDRRSRVRRQAPARLDIRLR